MAKTVRTPPTELDELRARGQRVTTARRAVIQTLLGADHELSPGEVAAAIEVNQPDTHLSTVYRTLEALEASGIVVHVHAHGGVAYQLASRVTPHAECDSCGRTIALPANFLDQIAKRLRRDHDFELDTQHVPLLGRCNACRRQRGAVPHRHTRS